MASFFRIARVQRAEVFTIGAFILVTSIAAPVSTAFQTASGGDETPPIAESIAGGPPNPLQLSRPSGTSAGFFSWVSPLTNFKLTPVQCNGVNIGRLDFKYRSWRDVGFSPNRAGAALEGGFTVTGGNPCPDGQQPTEYIWIQTITTNRPLPGRGPGTYVDSDNPRTDPVYPYQSDNNNPSDNPFTGRSFYDGPSRNEEAAANVEWLAENILCCRTGHKINVIGSFVWGFDINADGLPNNGVVNVIAPAPIGWGPVTGDSLTALRNEARGTRFQRGWSVSNGCCCSKPVPIVGISDETGESTVPVITDDPSWLDDVVIFPRNHLYEDAPIRPPTGWTVQPWGSNIAPPLPGQTQGDAMFQNGILFSAKDPPSGPQEIEFHFQLSGHESFFDVFLHDGITGEWTPWTLQTQELLCDMDGDDSLTPADIPAWDLAFQNPKAYADQYPGLNPIFRGDLTHNGALDLNDRQILQIVLLTVLPTDAQDMAPPCPADVGPNGGDATVNVNDLLEVINHWGPCPRGSSCESDVTQDGVVNVNDLLAVINQWGPCPK